MHRLYILLFTLCVFSFYQCKKTTKLSDGNTANVFGEDFKVKQVMEFDKLITEIAQKDTVRTVVKAKVTGVCQVKGCWMTLLSPSNDSSEEVFVKFKDYGFFMPLDLAGNEVLVNGKAYKEITSVDELKHYAEDEGQTAEEIAKITEPMEEFKMMATGVKLLP